MSIALHWFRNDLRLRDNTALFNAAAHGQAACLYIATPAQWREHDDAPIKQDFWRRNLQLLETALNELNIPLLYAEVPAYRDIPALLEGLLPALQVSSLHCNREYPLNECRRDSKVEEICRALYVDMQIHDDQTLFAPGTVLNRGGRPFKVFTPYARTVRALMEDLPLRLLPAPRQQVLPSLPRLSACRSLRELSWPAVEAHWEKLWPAGEQRAHAALQTFIGERIDAYAEQRNFPAVDGTSRLSPFLSSGVLSVRQCWQASLQTMAGEGVHTWQNELIWHDFYKHIMRHFPHVCRKQNWREGLEGIPWRDDKEEFRRWCGGQTGIPIIDAAMRQLQTTGWMHNRLRMIAAMFLSKHLLIDWRLGEQWFMQHLIDGDFSANNGGWQWSASTGTDATPYFRIFNPVTQSQRFDPDGAFIREWLPELAQLDAKAIHDPGPRRPDDYPAPMIDLAFGRERAMNAFKL